MSDLTSAKRWFREARLGAFIHWGLYALPGGVWNGTSVPYLAEWLQAARRIPNAEYARLAEQFNPKAFDADAIVKAFADAGMRYVVFTAKHHEGFAMWHSRVSPFNSYDATPAHRDFVAEWADACRRHGVKLGLYYSHCLDWHEPDGGDPRPCPDNFGMSWGNDWDFPDQTAKNFDRYFENKALPQLAELLTGYGEVAVLWLDCPMQVITPHHARRILDLVRRLQPNCLVNSRLCSMCKTLGDYGSLGDNQLPAGVTDGDFPREAIVTLNDSWGYKATDHHWKSPAQIRQIVLDAMQSGANLLVNFGPDGDGQLTSASWAILRDLAEWQPAIGEALHSGGQTPFPQDLGWAHAVAADRRLWLFPHPDAPAVATLAGINDKVLKINNIQTFVQKRQPIRLDFPETPIYDPCPCIQNGRMTLLPSKAELIHGENIIDNGAVTAQLGAAGERLGEGTHSRLADNGALSDWHNPADCCRWNVRLDPGRYQLRLITRNAAHSQPWRGDRQVEIALGDQSITASLEATDLFEDSKYYRAAATDLGEISLDHGGKCQLSLRTVRLTAPEAAAMQLERLELHAVL